MSNPYIGFGVGVFVLWSFKKAQENRRLRYQNAHLNLMLWSEGELIKYLLDIIERNDIEANEFDEIVLSELCRRLEGESA